MGLLRIFLKKICFSLNPKNVFFQKIPKPRWVVFFNKKQVFLNPGYLQPKLLRAKNYVRILTRVTHRMTC